MSEIIWSADLIVDADIKICQSINTVSTNFTGTLAEEN